MTIQADVPNKLVQMAIWTFTLHPPRQSHQAVDVLHLCSHLETLYIYMQNELCVTVWSFILQKKVTGSTKCYHLSDFEVCLAVQVRCFDVAHTLWFTVMEGERLDAWSTPNCCSLM